MFSLKGAYSEVPSEVELSQQGQTPTPRPVSIASWKQTWSQRHLRGWRFGVLNGALLASLVLVLNLIVTILAMVKQTGLNGGRKILFEGDCAKAEKLNVLAHLLINALSTILLSASNYCMQCLSAPTRKEIDQAHSRKKWLDIGVLSIQNIRRISKKRGYLWFALGASSMPLHLFYNSAVFSTISAVEYSIFSVTPDMLSANSSNKALGVASNSNLYTIGQDLYNKASSNQLDHLSPADCITAYAVNFQTERGNVILVTNDTNLHGPRSYNNFASAIQPGTAACLTDPFDWICGQDASHGCVTSNPCFSQLNGIDRASWKPLGNQVSYCLSEKAQQHCKIQFSTQLAWTVIVFNLSKAVILLSVFFFVKETPLMTMGDAVSSFLMRPDGTTEELCLMSRSSLALWRQPPIPQAYRQAKGKEAKWSSTVSSGRWGLCMSLYALALILCIFLFFYGIVGKVQPASTLMSLGLGAINPATFIFGWGIPSTGISGVIANVLVANSPQVILSAIYYSYNSLFTCFMAGQEWSQYAIQRKGLRVSARPGGSQRSTYFLQLPYRVALPLMILSGLLHWLTSQSIFLVSVEEPDPLGLNTNQDPGDEFLTCGYSPPAILSVIIIGITMVSVAYYLGNRKFKGGIPVAATCSASISAMCHIQPEEREDDVAHLPVQWGVTAENVDVFDSAPVSHCSFSSKHVRMPCEGELCAGSRHRK